MLFRVRYHPDVKTHDIPRLGTMRERVRRAVETRLMTEPHKFGVPLRKNLRGYWKLRIGDYRVVFVVEGQEVFVLIICHRKDVYEKVAAKV